ncbi:MAG TPA: oligosaccharide flippase family protein [Nitrososphaeraceae archaeon]|nr:oligosaccharide flippase family protein [Nitrososphaeraceae archaeon]
MSADSNDVIEPQNEIESISTIGAQGTLLFLDHLLVAVGGWIYWLVIVSRISPSEVGQVTAVYSLVTLISILTQLGLEYPVLKRSSTQPHEILATAFIIELVITMTTVPVVPYIISTYFQQSLHGLSDQFSSIAVIILLLSSLSFVSRFALLGVSDVKSVLIIDLLGTAIKFASGYALVWSGMGAKGMLISFLLQNLVLVTATIFVTRRRRKFGYQVGNIHYIKAIIKDGLTNTPSKFSRTLILSLSVVLLGSFGISSSDVGIFYIALMVSIVAIGSLASSMAYMVIPLSAALRTDLSSASSRISMSLSVPMIAAVISSPKFILSIIGMQYVPGETVLLVLSIAILPFSITMNSISKFNNLQMTARLIAIGLVEIIAFLIAFVFLVPHYGALGAAFSTLTAFASSSLLSLAWSDRRTIRYVGVSALAMSAGFVVSHIINLSISIHPVSMILISMVISLGIIIILRNISTNEINQLAKGIIAKIG